MKNLKAKVFLGLITLNTALVSPLNTTVVHADDGDGGFQDAMGVMQEAGLIDKLKRPISIILNIICFGLAIYCAIRAVIYLIQSKQEDNPSEAKLKKKAAISNGIGAAIAISGVIIINIVLSLLGIPFIFGV